MGISRRIWGFSSASTALTESATIIAVTWTLLRPLGGASWISIDASIGRSGGKILVFWSWRFRKDFLPGWFVGHWGLFGNGYRESRESVEDFEWVTHFHLWKDYPSTDSTGENEFAKKKGSLPVQNLRNGRVGPYRRSPIKPISIHKYSLGAYKPAN